jgi:hypothetical protein
LGEPDAGNRSAACVRAGVFYIYVELGRSAFDGRC